jgi:uncharacterized BrkB/YihY/UPF0761 family membrane protein
LVTRSNSNSYHVLGPLVLFIWRVVRWTIGLFTTILVLAMIYQFGTPRRRAWKYVLPGASGAAIIWFLTTLGFGFYLTRFADYSVVYGPLGAVVATLVWLYIATLSVLIGAEFKRKRWPPRARATQDRTLKLGASWFSGGFPVAFVSLVSIAPIPGGKSTRRIVLEPSMGDE